MLKENDLVKVHLYGCSNKEIKTGNYNKVFRVYRKNGVLGIDWNTSRSPYTNHGDIFTPCESFNKSYKYDFSGNGVTRIIEVENSDKTGTNEYSIVRITRDTAQECYNELCGQITDGIFENSRTGRIEEVK